MTIPDIAAFVERKIYTASKTQHADKWKALRARGFPIISTWIDEAGVGETQSFSDLWTRCILEAKSCDLLLCYREPGEVLKGAFIEVGAALASGKPVAVVGDFDGMSFLHHPLVSVYPSIDAALGEKP